MLDVTLREIEYVVEVATQRNYTRAAERLHMAQPALSQAILRVERRLGVQLFERSSRRVEPTAAGQCLADEGIQVLAAARRAVEKTLLAQVSDLSLTVHVSEPSLSVPRKVVNLLRSRGATVHPRTLPQSDVIEHLRDGRLTLAVGTPLRAKGISSLRIHNERVGVLMSEKHPLAARGSAPIADVAAYPILSIDEAMSSWNRYVEGLFARADVPLTWSRTVVFGAMASRDVLVDDRTVLITLASIGCDVVDGFTWRPLQPEAHAPWYVSWSKQAESTAAVQHALEALQDLLAPAN